MRGRQADDFHKRLLDPEAQRRLVPGETVDQHQDAVLLGGDQGAQLPLALERFDLPSDRGLGQSPETGKRQVERGRRHSPEVHGGLLRPALEHLPDPWRGPAYHPVVTYYRLEVAEMPDREAVACSSDRLTWADLQRRSLAIARRLAALPRTATGKVDKRRLRDLPEPS